MKKEDFFELIGEVDEQKVAVAGKIMTDEKKSKSILIKFGTLAACLGLIIASAMFLNSNSKLTPNIPKMNEDIDVNSPIIISQYTANVSSSYRAPEPGEYYCFVEVEEAREYYAGENVTYLLTFDLFKKNKNYIVDDLIESEYKEVLSDEEKSEEYHRLTGLGYKLYQAKYWTYNENDEKVEHPIIVGLFTEEELANFDANDMYGYAFRFVTNEDNSGIHVDESDLITNFPSKVE